MALIATLVDNFNDNSRNATLWQLNGLGTSMVAEVNQRVEITLVPNAASFLNGGYRSVSTYDLSNSAAMIEIQEYPTFAVSGVDLNFTLVDDSGHWVRWTEDAGSFKCESFDGTTTTTYITRTWNQYPAGFPYGPPRWLRIREDTGTIYWEWSRNGDEWYTLYRDATPASLTKTAVHLEFAAACPSGVAAPGRAVFDNVNVALVKGAINGVAHAQGQHFDWGVVDPASNAHYADLYAKGVRFLTVELNWGAAEPSAPANSTGGAAATFDDTAGHDLDVRINLIKDAIAAGFKIIFGFGMQDPPAWAQAREPFIDQYAVEWDNTANLIWNRSLRRDAEVYMAHCISRIDAICGAGTFNSFAAIRVGSGQNIELTHPDTDKFDSGNTNPSFGAYSASAAATVPASISGFTPGDTGYSNADIRSWYSWYLDNLADAWNWQVAWLRGSATNPPLSPIAATGPGYTGYVLALAPGKGAAVRPVDYETLLSNQLLGDPQANRGSCWLQVARRLYDPLNHVIWYCSSFAEPDSGIGGSPSGEPMPVGDLNGWRQIFTEDFNDDAALGSFDAVYGDRFFSYGPGWAQSFGYPTPARYDSPQTLSASGGILDAYLHQSLGYTDVNGVTGDNWLSPAIQPYINGFGNDTNQLYGRYAVRFRSPSPIQSYKTAYLLWPNTDSPDFHSWPHDGEIDFPEGQLDGTINAYMHRQDGVDGGDQDGYETAVTYTAWHTAVIEWGPSHCRFFLDGALIGDSTSRIPSGNMHYVLQSEALWGTAPAPGSTGHLQIDWVAVWAYDTGATGSAPGGADDESEHISNWRSGHIGAYIAQAHGWLVWGEEPDPNSDQNTMDEAVREMQAFDYAGLQWVRETHLYDPGNDDAGQPFGTAAQLGLRIAETSVFGTITTAPVATDSGTVTSTASVTAAVAGVDSGHVTELAAVSGSSAVTTGDTAHVVELAQVTVQLATTDTVSVTEQASVTTGIGTQVVAGDLLKLGPLGAEIDLRDSSKHAIEAGSFQVKTDQKVNILALPQLRSIQATDVTYGATMINATVWVHGSTRDELARNWREVVAMVRRANEAAGDRAHGSPILFRFQLAGMTQETDFDVLGGTFPANPLDGKVVGNRAIGQLQLTCRPFGHTALPILNNSATLQNGSTFSLPAVSSDEALLARVQVKNATPTQLGDVRMALRSRGDTTQFTWPFIPGVPTNGTVYHAMPSGAGRLAQVAISVRVRDEGTVGKFAITSRSPSTTLTDVGTVFSTDGMATYRTYSRTLYVDPATLKGWTVSNFINTQFGVRKVGTAALRWTQLLVTVTYVDRDLVEHITTLTPSGNGALTQWTVTGAASTYLAVNQNPDDGDTSYARSATDNQVSLVTLPPFTAIDAATVAVRGHHAPLVDNGGFERWLPTTQTVVFTNDFEDLSGVFPNFGDSTDSSYGNATGHSGNGVYLTRGSTGTLLPYLTLVNGLQGGFTYTFSLWVKSTGTAHVSVADPSLTIFYAGPVSVTGGTWQQVSLSVAVPGSTVQSMQLIVQELTATQTTTVDQLVQTRQETLPEAWPTDGVSVVRPLLATDLANAVLVTPNDGVGAAYFAAATGAGLYQAVSVTPGAQYLISAMLWPDPTNVAFFSGQPVVQPIVLRADCGGPTIGTVNSPVPPATGTAGEKWQYTQLLVKATGPTLNLHLVGKGWVDSVNIEPVSLTQQELLRTSLVSHVADHVGSFRVLARCRATGGSWQLSVGYGGALGTARQSDFVTVEPSTGPTLVDIGPLRLLPPPGVAVNSFVWTIQALPGAVDDGELDTDSWLDIADLWWVPSDEGYWRANPGLQGPAQNQYVVTDTTPVTGPVEYLVDVDGSKLGDLTHRGGRLLFPRDATTLVLCLVSRADGSCVLGDQFQLDFQRLPQIEYLYA